MSEPLSFDPWWGEVSPADARPLALRIGPARVFLARLEHEWRLGLLRGDEDSATTTEPPAPVAMIPEEAETERFVFTNPSNGARLAPAPADRPVVSRPINPLNIPVGEEARIYVSAPVWLRVTVEGATLIEWPLERPSDSWFGPSTMEGEVCYAIKILGRTRLEDVVWRPHRAVTPIRIVNNGDAPLRLARLAVPAPNLSLYGAANGKLWTSAVTARASREESVEVEVEPGPPPDAGAAVELCGPRKDEANNFLRSITAIFG